MMLVEIPPELSDVTPSDLKAMRLRLGMDPAELATLLGMPGRRDIVENLEKARTWTMFERHQDALVDLEEAVENIARRILEAPRPAVLIGYPNDGVFREFAPEIAKLLGFNSVHRMMLAKIQSSLSDHPDDLIPIVEIIPSRYAEWLGASLDTPDTRVEWALQHIEVYRTKPGLPVAGQPES
ncbi:helix-turn-helix domain-containing protein [Alsobacter sp. SYSU BS001988]